ncbi:MAG: type II toxin-antitoxin system HicA family toxin, partial [Candidatus Omnitrophota bacterium]
MPKLPLISAKEAIKAFEKIGYQVIRQRGSH